jgi:hypothetical protein
MAGLTQQVVDQLRPEEFPLVHKVWRGVAGDPNANVEIVLRQLYHLLALCEAGPELTEVEHADVQRSISAIQDKIAEAFLVPADVSVHCRLVEQVCRLNTRVPATIATSNYDLLVEHACDAARISCFDGFVGGDERKWCVESLPLWVGTVGPTGRFRFYPRAVRLLKLHGSVSWATDGEGIVAFPFGVLPDTGKWLRRLIYPAPPKVSESFDEPYSSLLRHFTRILERPNGLLLTLGFSYRDAHLVEPIRQFLSTPDHTLVALVQQPEGLLTDLLGRPNVVCVSESGAWLDSTHLEDNLDIWQLPHLVRFLEEP